MSSIPRKTNTRPTVLSSGSRKRSGSTTDDHHPPVTPRLAARFSDQPVQEIPAEESTSNTPTKVEFKFPADVPSVSRQNSRRSVHSHQSSDSQDLEMGDDEDDEDGHENAGGSDNESGGDDDEQPSRKKKKGQKFYCTDFPPCNLSFTRSEHLARHIR
jgi:hypothetical protein